jgi:hypothetical protein
MEFEKALLLIKTGAKVSRSGWNGKGMYVALVLADQWGLGPDAPYDLGRVGNRNLPWIGIRTADNAFVPWLASQTDILAEDWVLFAVPPPPLAIADVGESFKR